ncbi:hypothetical protein [Sphingomonas sp. NFR15]|uniref:hypothetical protein n=1 Tax=Sphingomonas sp. NFR15 TaxID=1566282 RepID=UPI000888BF88|nr:hypothetical protein [Sphingomonas sp. NFR15]SDA10928.1 hypothetical protein SAMN03159340_00076 [Sphingomonas sp. NFR15]
MTIEDTLGALAGSPVHPALETIDNGVFSRIDATARTSRQARGGMLVAVAVATITGAAGAAIPGGRGVEPSVVLVNTALAPSTLLGGVE